MDCEMAADNERPWKPAVAKGLRLRCPKCGKGKLLHSYLKVNDQCAECGEELFHQRADDGPAYLTILIVGHILGFALHFIYTQFKPEPLFFALWLSAIAVVSSLLLLPRMKGLMVAYQWSQRMHGFGKTP
ncbi:hypothetical protein XMM379_001755 [Aliiroseovarius sp. xm-m-379]|uniref:DUF983 domain-containing protein n=2 Tax=Paracoccaceae TaxID=31989 RepID=A0A9Q9LX12_9RHOB|nr:MULTISPECIES: DUF983 domain-containing protein [Aliiroseovarius]NRP13564.1 hypothetical protein [Aliiroseovarius sp. xm-d-517]NRP41296.1 hypothetical protein [Aliiroseovarius sp. xm-m-339-2]NRP25064.1 hypothetical protein [Aliiroseovarius sp. xm-m-379]NRP31415.1 hypothetical protein [Aliiroseovarius sp. xm-m-314]NRP33863.1 hypothetical protein [Aliiroseovarius sp. xm-a-104]